MQSLTSEETYAAKHAFERFAKQHSITTQHYHADNGRFANNMFINECEQQKQQLTFCGINTHFQNGIAKWSIRDLTKSARKQLLHAHQHWPAAVHLALWPYELRSACYLHNNLPVLEDGTSCLEKFSGIRIGTRMKDFHAFACPVFALHLNEGLPRFCMPGICIAKCACRWQYTSTMVTPGASRPQARSKPITCSNHQPCPQPHNWPLLATISLQF